MKILHIIPRIAPRYGGPCKVANELCQALVEKGHKASIFTTNIDGDKDLDVPLNQPVYKNGVEIRYFRGSFPRYWVFSIGFWKAISKLIKKFDVVHIHSLYLFVTLIAAYYCRRYDIPYLVRPHGTLDPFLLKKRIIRKKTYIALFEKRNLNGASAIHYTTEDEMNLANGLNIQTKGIVIPVGLNLQDYEKLPPQGIFRKEYPEIGQKTIVLFFGRIDFKKGIDILIKAFGKALIESSDMHLVITGPENDKYGNEVRNWVKEEQIEESVTITGMLLGEEKFAVLSDADIFVLPSYSENMGLAVIEAMACRLPVIISNRVNICHDVEEYNAGIVTECDVEQFANAIIHLHNNPQLRREIGACGKELVRKKYVWARIVEQMIDCYEKIIKESRSNFHQK